MTRDETVKVLRIMESTLLVQWKPTQLEDLWKYINCWYHGPDDTRYYEDDLYAHIRWMCLEAQKFEDLDKMFRWLGFIQGVLVAYGMCTIDDMRRLNKGEGL